MTTWVFAGDSVTDAGRRDDPAGLGEGYVRRVADRAGADADVVNAGIGGDRAIDLLRRWDDDVLALRPDLVTILIGVNDTWRRYDAGTPTSAEEFREHYRRMLDAVMAPLVLMDPFVLPVTVEQERWVEEDLGAKIDVVRELATGTGAVHVPLQEILAARPEPAQALAADGVHPTALGHRIIADAWWSRVAGV